MYRGRKFGYILDTGDPETAEGLRGGVKKTLMLQSERLTSAFSTTPRSYADCATLARFAWSYGRKRSIKQQAPLADDNR
jgi:hypothetical protein